MNQKKNFFNLKKVRKARKRLKLITDILFKFFQINLKYKEKRKDYGLEIFEYFYLPWRVDDKFNEAYDKISEFTLNPKSRLFTIYDYSKKYLLDGSSFVEVGSWRGGVCGLVSLLNTEKKINIYACDTFKGVANASSKDSFFQNNEYSDNSTNYISELNKLSKHNIEIVEGIFPASAKDIDFNKKISMAHIDVDTYISAKESFEFISKAMDSGGLIILDDYGGWFTDGVTKFGNELKENNDFFVSPNHLGQLIIYKK